MTDARGIQGAQRVAAFLLSLEPEVATKVLETLGDELVTKVAQAMVDLDPRLASDGAVDELYRRIAVELNGPRRLEPCDPASLEQILGRVFGAPKARQLVQEIQRRRLEARPFLPLESHPGPRLARVLAAESPAVQALVLSYLAPPLAAEVLGTFEKERALEVVQRMATLTPPGAKVLRPIAEDLARRLAEAAALEAETPAQGRLESLAEMLHHAAPDIEKGAIQSIAAFDAGIASELRERMFAWEDLATVDKRVMQKILGTVDTKTLAVAIKACSPAVEQNLLGNLSARVRDIVAEERELAGAMPMSTVLEAREEILRNIRAMIETGEFRPSRSGEDLVR